MGRAPGPIRCAAETAVREYAESFTSPWNQTSLAREAAYHLSLLRWAATLLPPADAARVGDELDATGLASAAVPFLPVVRDDDGERGAMPSAELVVALRGALTVPDCDALLDAGPFDGEAIAVEHGSPSAPWRRVA
ncbi:hypothetical protein OG259_40870 [Streptomyces sp. NBC_00250]|uniref:hypothetical protein n=1 Tax=Streptomyces sp. NBC_00250 TaxID=2903641 RepID=UPI002E29078E|nr:hypothetical protein [Streptomyces sp. NBC_00250]